MSAETPTATVVVPMPIAGTAGAPSFNGKDADEFLDAIILHGYRAGITDHNKLVNYITTYSSQKVRKVIRYLPEFDKDAKDRTWKTASETLLALYSASNEPPKYTLDDLETYCKKTNARPAFASKSEVDVYRQGFLSISAALVKRKKTTDEVVRTYFVAGIPEVLQDWFVHRVPEANRTNDNPPTIQESVDILYQKFNENALTFKPWDEKRKGSTVVHFDDSDEEAEDSPNQATQESESQRVPSRSTSSKTTNGQVNPTDNYHMRSEMDTLSRQLEKLTLQLLAKNGVGNNDSAANASRSEPDVSCFICGTFHPSPRSPARCPETPALLREDLITFDLERKRYIKKDGSELPRVPYGQPGGVAAMLRAEKATREQTRSEFRRDPPPHQSAAVNMVGLSDGRGNVLGGNVFAVGLYETEESSDDDTTYTTYADPALRSGRDTNIRFDPTARPDKGKIKADSSKQTTKPKPATVSTPNPVPEVVPPTSKIAIPPPKNPINREDGWRMSQPSRDGRQKTDVEMKDETKRIGPSQQYFLTSDLQERVDTKAILDKVLDQSISLSLGDLIGSSPALQKLITDATRSRREYKVPREASTSLINTFDPFNGVDSEMQTLKAYQKVPKRLSISPEADMKEVTAFMVRYSSAITTMPSAKYYAMVTGVMDIEINGVRLAAMIDTGSELNLASFDLPSKTGLPLDFEGMKWSLKGIHGGPEQLAGVVTDAPVKLGNHAFPHHLFVSRYRISDKYDIILGQPFLQWYACRIDYFRSGVVKLYLWRDADKERKPTIVINITDPTDPRNTSEIARKGCDHGTGNGQAASVEEVEDEENIPYAQAVNYGEDDEDTWFPDPAFRN